jgi:hypothetical protein
METVRKRTGEKESGQQINRESKRDQKISEPPLAASHQGI